MTNRHRVRVVTRYVDGIRGTLTGQLVALDKHWNLILRDVDEHYTPPRRRQRDDDDDEVEEPMSNVEVEVQRRLRGTMNAQSSRSSSTGSRVADERSDWTNRQRHMRLILVRGDNVVAVYKAADERSAWPVTSKSPTVSEYRCHSMKRGVPPEQRVGTPGSLIYAAARQLRQQRQKPPQRKYSSNTDMGKRDYRSSCS